MKKIMFCLAVLGTVENVCCMDIPTSNSRYLHPKGLVRVATKTVAFVAIGTVKIVKATPKVLYNIGKETWVAASATGDIVNVAGKTLKAVGMKTCGEKLINFAPKLKPWNYIKPIWSFAKKVVIKED